MPLGQDPWKDWIPGVLSEKQVLTLCEEQAIRNAVKRSVDASALDLHLSEKAYRMKSGSMKPVKGVRYHTVLREYAKRLPNQTVHTLEAKNLMFLS